MTRPLRSVTWLGTIGLTAVPLFADQARTLSADETRAMVAEMMADLDQNSSFAEARSADDVDITVGGYFQFRYVASFTDDDDDDAAGDQDDFESGFQFQRTRLYFKGSTHENLGFLVIAAAGPNGDFTLQDAVVKYDFGNSGWALTAGQLKLPFFREWLVSEKFILPVERSNVTQVFSSGYNQGLVLKYTNDSFRFNAAFSDGIRSINTTFFDESEADYALTARGEWLPFGNWGQFTDLTSLGNSDRGLLIGAAVHHQGETESLGGFDLNHLTQYTVDVSYEAEDWGAFVAGVGRHYEDAEADDDFNDFGAIAQAAVFLDDSWELFGRYSILLPDEDAAGDDTFSTVTLGVNNYLYGHAAKFTIDAVWFLDETTDTSMLNLGPHSGTALRASDEENQFAIRAQFQLIF